MLMNVYACLLGCTFKVLTMNGSTLVLVLISMQSECVGVGGCDVYMYIQVQSITITYDIRIAYQSTLTNNICFNYSRILKWFPRKMFFTITNDQRNKNKNNIT